MSSCNTFPTLTRTDEVVTNSLSTSSSTHLTTLPPTTTTITLTSTCTATSGVCSAAQFVSTSIIPGGTSTVVDVVTITVPITSSQLTTLFGTSCTQTVQDSDTNTPTPSSTPPTPTPTPTPTSFSTPPPAVFTSASSSTQANGNITPIIYTVTSTQSPIAISQSAVPGNAGNTGSDKSKNLGPIIGGVVGGVVGLVAIVFLIWFILRRRRRWDDIFENDDDVPTVAAAAMRKEKPADIKPQPYQYGLVGHTKSPSLTSPPASPPPGVGPVLGDNKFDHRRANSNTPLLHSSLSTTTQGAPSTSPRPPSSVGSMQGYGPQDVNMNMNMNTNTNMNIQGQGWDPSLLYNSTVPQQPQFTGAPVANAAVTMMGRRDVDNRAGSPVSLQEQRILQVTNADMGPQSPVSPTSPEPRLDGKGRFAARNEKAPIVHLDGGRFQQPIAAGSSAAAVSAPPAYSES